MPANDNQNPNQRGPLVALGVVVALLRRRMAIGACAIQRRKNGGLPDVRPHQLRADRRYEPITTAMRVSRGGRGGAIDGGHIGTAGCGEERRGGSTMIVQSACHASSKLLATQNLGRPKCPRCGNALLVAEGSQVQFQRPHRPRLVVRRLRPRIRDLSQVIAVLGGRSAELHNSLRSLRKPSLRRRCKEPRCRVAPPWPGQR